jgi:hypothetical protein
MRRAAVLSPDDMSENLFVRHRGSQRGRAVDAYRDCAELWNCAFATARILLDTPKITHLEDALISPLHYGWGIKVGH